VRLVLSGVVVCAVSWFSGRDNQFTNSIPPFIGSEIINIDTNYGATPYSIFIQIFTDELFVQIANFNCEFIFKNNS